MTVINLYLHKKTLWCHKCLLFSKGKTEFWFDKIALIFCSIKVKISFQDMIIYKIPKLTKHINDCTSFFTIPYKNVLNIFSKIFVSTWVKDVSWQDFSSYQIWWRHFTYIVFFKYNPNSAPMTFVTNGWCILTVSSI